MAIATRAHTGQCRKGTQQPYISHPLAVAALAIEYGADEEQVLAALLHDAIEDGGSAYATVIRYDLGEPVLQLVEALSDASAEHKAALTDAAQRIDDWHQRKRTYLARLVDEGARVLLVSACDKLHNLRAIRYDLAAHGLATFARFTAARADTLWYYVALADVLCPRLAATHAALATALRAEVDALHAEVTQLLDADGAARAAPEALLLWRVARGCSGARCPHPHPGPLPAGEGGRAHPAPRCHPERSEGSRRSARAGKPQVRGT